jgi:cytochrome c biogenesis protein CcdA
MIDFIQNISSPCLIAFLSGLGFMLDPCTLLVNISAIGYLSKDYAHKKIILLNSFFYILGKILVLAGLGVSLVLILKKGYSISHFQSFFNTWGEIILVPVLFIFGLTLIFADKISWLKISFSVEKIENRFKHDNIRAFVLGAVLSLIFCPANVILFFGILLPLSLSVSYGMILPFIFVLATILIIVLITVIMTFGLNKIDKFYKIADKLGRWFVKITGTIFILIGIYLLIEHIFFIEK